LPPDLNLDKLFKKGYLIRIWGEDFVNVPVHSEPLESQTTWSDFETEDFFVFHAQGSRFSYRRQSQNWTVNPQHGLGQSTPTVSPSYSHGGI
jgi:hypothetical protein